MQSEFALVTCGCAAALLQITAACMAGTDPELMCMLPDTNHPGMKTDVLVQRDQRDDYDAAVRMTGAHHGRDGRLLAIVLPPTACSSLLSSQLLARLISRL